MATRKPQRALISVYDKTGIIDFARVLVDEFGIEIISTGGTARLLTDAEIPVTLVEDVTGCPELLDGRVKTLHPKIHAAILADRDNPDHMRQLDEQGIKPIDMVVVNLYPFEKTVADPTCTFEQAIEMIDIGGVTLLRAAAKNHKHVLVLSSPVGYRNAVERMRSPEGIDWQHDRRWHAYRAFWASVSYDAAIAPWLATQLGDDSPIVRVDRSISWGKLRYGENPHQTGELFGLYISGDEPGVLWPGTYGTGGKLSFNNFVDANAALELCKEITSVGTVWHRRLAGENEAVATIARLSEESYTRRNLPHIQRPGKTYFVTFRLKEGQLPPDTRDIVLQGCRYWHGKKTSVHIAIVMPDHVHLLLTPYYDTHGETVSLGELLHSIKGFTAKEINKAQGRSGPVWLDETWDRIMRSEKEFAKTCDYIETNPVRSGLPGDYPWIWKSTAGFEEGGVAESKAPSHRRDAGATQLTSDPCCVCVKHTNACGVGVAEDPVEAYRRAYHGDPNAAMGGVLACNFGVSIDFASVVMETYGRWGKDAGAGGFFVEVWIAPSFDDEAVDVIRTAKKWGERVRLLAIDDLAVPPDENELDFKKITGGMLVQPRDLVGLNEGDWQVATRREPTGTEMDDLRLAWLVCKHTKSNAITICKDGMLIGNGAGQMSRVMSCRIATWLANENGHAEQLAGAVAASDAFFPFRDGPDLLVDAGVTAIIQPGGSKRDQEVIDACNEREVAMVLTGTRHFKH